MSLLSLPRDRARRRRFFTRITNVGFICALSLTSAWVITRPTGGAGFHPPAAVRAALLGKIDVQAHPVTALRTTAASDGATSADNPVNHFGYKLPPGPYPVTELGDLVLHDAQRDKLLHLRIFYPQSGGPYPVIVFSHGAGGSQNCCEELTRHWATYGYITIQPTHDDSALQRRDAGAENVRFTQVVRDALQQPALWESRPKDISFVLDSLGEIEKRVPQLTGKIDRQHIGVGGHSMGSFTAEAVAGALVDLPGKLGTSFADSRVKAALCLSPQGPGQFGLTPRSFKSVAIPYLGVTGSQDSLGPLANAAWHKLPFDLSPAGNKYHLFLDGANHMSFITASAPLSANSEHGDAILGYTNSAALAFWDAYLKTDGNAKAYLQSNGLASFSKGSGKLDRK